MELVLSIFSSAGNLGRSFMSVSGLSGIHFILSPCSSHRSRRRFLFFFFFFTNEVCASMSSGPPSLLFPFFLYTYLSWMEAIVGGERDHLP